MTGAIAFGVIVLAALAGAALPSPCWASRYRAVALNAVKVAILEEMAMTPESIEEFAKMRAEFAKEIGRLNEKVRALHAASVQNRAAVNVELELLRRDVEALEDGTVNL